MSAAMQLIARTGQMGKFYLGLGLLAAATAVLMLGVFFAEALTLERLIPLTIVASGLGITGFTYLCTAIRCQNCGARWIWLMATTRPGDPFHINFRSNKCPACGSTG